MKPKTEELLYFLLWSCEHLSRPTWRSFTESFEGWAYRNGLHRQLARLEQAQFLEQKAPKSGERHYRLTHAGRLYALGGRDPDACWNRPWDGKWRLALFDVPREQGSTREKLRRYLRDKGFGYLQGSVWISPDSLTEERRVMASGSVDVESLLFLEARPCTGETDEEIVAGAWDFVSINRNYERYLTILGKRPSADPTTESAARMLRRWAASERESWWIAVTEDPLLPKRLLPRGYLGQKAWQARIDALAQAAHQIHSFGG